MAVYLFIRSCRWYICRFLVISTSYGIKRATKNHHKHLAVWLESFLCWDYQINSIFAKANKVLGLIRRTFGPNNSEEVSTAYKTLVRPILEYGCQVCNPYLVKHIISIEAIQRPLESFVNQSKNIRKDLGSLNGLRLSYEGSLSA